MPERPGPTKKAICPKSAIRKALPCPIETEHRLERSHHGVRSGGTVNPWSIRMSWRTGSIESVCKVTQPSHLAYAAMISSLSFFRVADLRRNRYSKVFGTSSGFCRKERVGRTRLPASREIRGTLLFHALMIKWHASCLVVDIPSL